MKKPILKLAAMALSAAIMAAPTTYVFAAESTDTVLSSEDVAETVQTEDTGITTADTGSGAYYYVMANILNVRSGPGTNYSLVGTYTQGTRGYVHSISGGWAKVRFNGVTAYASAQYLAKV